MHRVDVTILVSKTVSVPVYDEEYEIVDCGYEYDPCEEGTGEFWQKIDYSNLDLEAAVRREDVLPEGWTIEELTME